MKATLLALCALALTIPNSLSAVELTATSSDGTKLAGTLHIPDGHTPFPVVVFTHGSEPGVRASEGYLRWSKPFVEAGIGVLIYDKRGCGESEGTYVEAPDIAVPAADLSAWVDMLAARDDTGKIGVLGWSQGGWVGPMAASQNKSISYVVAISGSGVSPLEQNIFDKTNQCAATGATHEQVATFENVIRLVWTYIITGENETGAQEAWDAVAEEAWFEKAYNGPPMMDRDRLLQHPRMTSFVAHSTFSPTATYQKVNVPLLAVFGEADTVVPVDRSISALQNELGERDLLTIQTVPGADHGLRVGASLADGYPGKVVEWVKQTVAD